MAKKEEKKAAPAKEVVAQEKKPQVPAEHVGGGAVATYQEAGAWGSEEITSEDIIIPKILLMQPMSELVTDGKATIGQFRDSLNTERVLGSVDKPVEIIVFGSFKTWLEFKDGEYLSTKRMDATNADLPIEEILEDQSVITRDKVLNFFCLLPSDIESGEAFPYVLSCRRTSYQTGKKLSTHIKKLSMFKKPSASKVFMLSCSKETNDKGTFFVTDADPSRDTTPTEMAKAYEWYVALAKSKVKVDESDLTKDSTTSNAPSPSTSTQETQAMM